MANKPPLFVTGIGTDVGKTVVSAILVEKLKADYWKPIQSGDLDNTDTMKVQALISNPISKFQPEAYRLTQPFSPHKSADLDGIAIDLNQIMLPQTDNQLIIEGAGGLMVPLNNQHFIIDLIQKFDAEVVLVVKHYLGSINHTLLSLELLKQKKIKVRALIFNGDSDEYAESAIISHSSEISTCRIKRSLKEVDKAFILNENLNNNTFRI
ncbi:dethiobiotin synthase [Mucilaginibacter galii]|uniref:ATP-dependent dethiobiotin synthetase BioD n=1 Tax=Mucilaginibacter galii TaxID=2005073 RepID=A0A917N242_9SPHI|nr:dethiobiotin synthase [Mucilaginibacter galii]GGI51546.1 ATP-dependent dethiobiotin synthetase BioD [Mucilaginibacter galii]